MKPLAVNKPSNLLPPVRRYRFDAREEYAYFEGFGEHPFEPNAADFRLVNAWWLMDASMLAYSKEPIVKHWCRRAGFSSVEWFSRDGTQCYLAIHENYVFVVFRGSDPPRRFRNFLIDWKLNFQISLVPFEGLPGSIHRGFQEALAKVSEAAASADGHGVGLLDRLFAIAERNPKATIWFTGHSQGAALAAIAAAQYVHAGGKAKLYSFASPKVGDKKFQRSFNVPAWRMVNSSDIITRLPFLGFYSRSAGLLKRPFLGRFRAVGELRFIDDRGAIGPKEVVHREHFRVFTYLQHRFRKFTRRFTNHAPIHYAVRITNAMVNEETNEFPVVSTGNAPSKWAWLKWSVAVFAFVLLGAQGAWVGLRWWFGYPPDPTVPPAAMIIENGLGTNRDEFYTLPEGSEMFPLAIAQSLRLPKADVERLALKQQEEADEKKRENASTTSGMVMTAARFVGSSLAVVTPADRTRLLDHLDLFGFIKVPASPTGNRLGYIGLSVNKRDGTGVEMLGVNCAACHVAQISHEGHNIRIDGAPNMLDIFGFVRALSESFKISNVNPLILAKEGMTVWAKEISLNGWSVYQNQVSRNKVLQQATDTAPLNGRADAFGTARAMFFGDFRPLTSPASYPHLWGLEKTAWYHWNTNTNSVIERNIGEALGLGAGFDPETCKTTVKFDALERLEKLAGKLTAPTWPPELGPIDMEAATRGEKTYLKECADCHDGYKTAWQGSRELNNYNTYSINEVGTDENEALNFEHSVQVNKDLCNGNQGAMEWRDFAEAHEILLGGVRFDSSVDAVSTPGFRLNSDRGKPRWKISVFCEKEGSPGVKLDPRDCPVYPAKPLVGIWATAPYLHNGSVPSILDLLTPPSARLTTFRVGQREYDPQRLGYSQDTKHTALSQLFETKRKGNSNSGHDYGTQLKEREKLDLIEFLKSLKEGDQERLNAPYKAKVK